MYSNKYRHNILVK